MKFSVVAVLGLAAGASAFVPTQHAFSSRTALPEESPVALEMANGRHTAGKVLRRTAAVFGTIALASSGIAPAANAAKTTVEAVKAADDGKQLVVGTAAAGAVLGAIGAKVFGGESPAPAVEAAPAVFVEEATKAYGPTLAKISSAFPGALANKELVEMVAFKLRKFQYGPTSLVASSLCADEVNRVLEQELISQFGDNFHMGGLAGFPFGGVTSFGAMASHIPDGGSCLVVYGPHVGVNTDGKVGTVERYGRKEGGSCCGSAIAASGYVESVSSGDASKAEPPTVPLDAQQNYVGNMLLPFAERLGKAEDKMVELPYCMYEAQKEMITQIVEKGAGNVAGNGKIAVLGGIQINTPEGQSDYFQPLSFEVFDNTGAKIEEISV